MMKEEHEKSIKELTDRVMALSDLNVAKEKEVNSLDAKVCHFSLCWLANLCHS